MKTRIYLLSILLLLIAQFLLAKPAIQKQSYYGVYNVAGAGGLNDENVTRSLMNTIQVMPLVVPDSSGFTHADSLCVKEETCFSAQTESIKSDFETLKKLERCTKFELRQKVDITVPAGAEKIIFQTRIYDLVFSDDQARDSRRIIFKLKPSASARVIKKGTKSIVELCESGRFTVISSKDFIGIDTLVNHSDGSIKKFGISPTIFFTSTRYDWEPLK
jgi:hypothetical protein